jgi:DNA repair protein RadC
MTNQTFANHEQEDRMVAAALAIIDSRLRVGGSYPIHESLKNFLRLHADGFAQDWFAIMYLDSKFRLIDYESVDDHPRDVVKQALVKSAEFVVLHHHRPRESCWPSYSDYQQATQLRTALDLIGVTVLDHVITSEEGFFSTVERGFG